MAYRRVPQFIYVGSTNAGMVKIGASHEPERRMMHWARASDAPTIIWVSDEPRSDAPAIERAIHHELRLLQHKGEWFWVDADHAVAVAKRLIGLAAIGALPKAPRIPHHGAAAAPRAGWTREQALARVRAADDPSAIPASNVIHAADVVSMLRRECEMAGGQSAWARAVGVAPMTVTDVLQQRRQPSAGILAALGLTRVVTYRRQVPRDRRA